MLKLIQEQTSKKQNKTSFYYNLLYLSMFVMGYMLPLLHFQLNIILIQWESLGW